MDVTWIKIGSDSDFKRVKKTQTSITTTIISVPPCWVLEPRIMRCAQPEKLISVSVGVKQKMLEVSLDTWICHFDCQTEIDISSRNGVIKHCDCLEIPNYMELYSVETHRTKMVTFPASHVWLQEDILYKPGSHPTFQAVQPDQHVMIIKRPSDKCVIMVVLPACHHILCQKYLEPLVVYMSRDT